MIILFSSFKIYFYFYFAQGFIITLLQYVHQELYFQITVNNSEKNILHF